MIPLSDVETLKQIRKSMMLRDADFSTFTSVLGWPVKGIWAPGSDGTDVNAVCRSNSKTLLVTADDNGLVKLFRFPSYDQKMQYRIYGGHSSHVTNVKFAANDTWVFSTGGQDCTVFQWRVVSSTTPSSSRRSSMSVNPAQALSVASAASDSSPVSVLRALQAKGQLSGELADRVERILTQPSIKEMLTEALQNASLNEADSVQKIKDLLR
jgi:WD40 repeat protein